VVLAVLRDAGPEPWEGDEDGDCGGGDLARRGRDEVEEGEDLEEISQQLLALEQAKQEEASLATTPPTKWWETMKITPDMYPDLQLTPAEQTRVRRAAMKMRTGLASSVPMTCPGRDRCPFARGWNTGGGNCEYAKIRKEPLGKPCIVEMDLIVARTQGYAESFNISDSPEETVDRLQCMELAEYDVYERRVTLALGEGDRAELVEENVIGVDEHENPIYARQIALAWSLKTQIKNRRDRVLKQLVATREAKYKRDAAMGAVAQDDHSTNFAGMMGRLEKIRADKEKTIQDAEFSEGE